MPPTASPIDLTGEKPDDDDETKPSSASKSAADASVASGYASLKVAELKSRLQQRGISFDDCVEKDDLVKRLESCAPSGTTTDAGTSDDSSYSSMKVAELKRRLQQRGISFADCIEKSDLIKRLESSENSVPAKDNSAKSIPVKENDNGKENAGRGGVGDVPSSFFSAGYNPKHAAAASSAAATAARNPNQDPLGPLADGESKTVRGSNATAQGWTIKRSGGVYHCNCPQWKFQPNTKSGEPRRCKHIDSLRAGYPPVPVDHSNNQNNNKKKRAATATTTKKNKSNKNAKTTSDDDSIDKEDILKVTLAERWDEAKQDPTGYYLSEKLDGMRCILKDGKLYSRNGNKIYAPEYFMDALPTNICLDGELFAGRQEFQSLMSIKSNPHDPRWPQVCYLVYDAPIVQGSFPARLEALRNALSSVPSDIAMPLEQNICTGKDHVEERLEYFLSQGGEGVMLKKAEPEYAHGRSKNLLKVKKFHDAEAIVLEHEPGKGRNKGRMGALKCKMTGSLNDKIFNIGSGFTDAERENPPPVGSTVTYKYQELTNSGIPRFPTYLRVRPVE